MSAVKVFSSEVSHMQFPCDHPRSHNIADAGAGMGTSNPVPDPCKTITRGGQGQQLLSASRLSAFWQAWASLCPLSPTACFPDAPGMYKALLQLLLVLTQVLVLLFRKFGSRLCMLSKKAQGWPHGLPSPRCGSWHCTPKQSHHSSLLPLGILAAFLYTSVNWNKAKRRKRHLQGLLCFLSNQDHGKSFFMG